MGKVRINDQQKLEACLAAMGMALATKDASNHKEASAFLKRQIGPGWTLVTAAQWLTGKAAWGAIDAMGLESVAGGCSKEEAMVIVAIATEFCRKFDASGGADLAMERLKLAAVCTDTVFT